MIIIIGLGNPEPKYKNTPHNIGFEILEKFARKNKFPDFSLMKKVHSLVSEKKTEKEKIILLKPLTFMNRSGKAVKAAIGFWKVSKEKTIIVHDDIDLPLGKIRIVKNRGSAGHKGIESIIQETKSKQFVRVRIGVKPETEVKDPEKFVLQKLSRPKGIEGIKEKAAEVISEIIEKGAEQAMNSCNSL